MSSTPTVADLFKFAQLQLSAEAFIRDSDLTLHARGEDLVGVLLAGNNHASRFTKTEAEDFANSITGWTALDQCRNTPTGFSGTLFKNNQTGELVLSFRSTEFIDDSARDSFATDYLEVAQTGFAWGQIREMESWYGKLIEDGAPLSGGKAFSVTGYSLGGQLATVFNILHPGIAEQVITFNGAGIGAVDRSTNLTSLVSKFKTLSLNESDHEIKFSDPNLAALYERARQAYKHGGSIDPADLAILNTMAYPVAESGIGPDLEARQVLLAIGRIDAIRAEVVRLTKVLSGDGHRPQGVADSQIGQEDLDYQMAVLRVSASTYADSILDGAEHAFGDKVYVKPSPAASIQFDVVADTTPSAVANSQWHIGTDVRVPIEDQPLFRGGIARSVAIASLKSLNNFGLKLLADGYATKDFGDTHSLVLLVDSLAVQNTLQQLLSQDQPVDPKLLRDILADASNLRAQDGDLLVGSGQGKAEGNTLESVVNALGRMFLGSAYTPISGSPDGNTWFEIVDTGTYIGRENFYKALQSIQTSPQYKATLGLAHLQRDIDPRDAATQAHSDFGVLLSLTYGAPFVLKLGKTVPDELQANQATMYKQWIEDRSLPASDRNFSDQYLQDRAAFLQRANYYDGNNAQYDTSQGAAPGDSEATRYDNESPIVWTDVASGITIRRGTPTVIPKLVAFGTGGPDPLLGYGNDDRLYGGAGNDTLTAQAGNDYLEGNSGDDQLDGGAGNDTLRGGAGTDSYVFAGTWGRDVVTDIDSSGLININGQDLAGGGTVGAPGGEWQERLSNGNVVRYRVVDSTTSTTGKQLVVTVQGDSTDSITITNFDADAAETGKYLGLHLDSTRKVAITQSSGASFWRDPQASVDSLAGKTSDIAEGGARLFTVYLNTPASGGESFVLHVGGASGQGLKAILGDTTVPADGATISLTEGQTQVSFALVQDGNLDADVSGSISVTYQGQDGRTATSNTWGLNLTDSGDPTNTLTGDFFAQTQVNNGGAIVRTGVNGAVTVVANGDSYFVAGGDGNLVGGGDTLVTDNVLLGTAGVDSISGGVGNDLLAGNRGNDQIDGGSGDDMIGGGAGNDQIRGGDGDDWISSASNAASDTQQMGPGDQWSQWGLPAGKTALAQSSTWGVYVSDQGTTIWSGIDQPATDAQSDAIDAGAGNDRVMASWGDDRVQGGDGNDVIEGLAGGDVLEGDAGDDTISGDGILTPGYLNTVAAESHGSDFIDGGEGNDSLTGGGAADDLFGGDGNDVIYGDIGVAGGDPEFLPLFAHGADYIDGEDGDDYAEGDGGSDTLYGGAGADNLWGDQSASRLTGAQLGDTAAWGDDYLDGEDGADTLLGGGGADTLFGGEGDDVAFGDESNPALPSAFNGNDYIDGEAGNDTIIAGGGNDYAYGGDGNDQISGDDVASQLPGQFHGSDHLDGEAGDDKIWGQGGGDEIYGGTGNDTLYGDESASVLASQFHGDDYLDGGDGDDAMFGQGGSDTLIGGAGNDALTGDDAPEALAGQFHGDDVLDGGDGDDTMIGGGGSDQMSGGSGNDILIGDDQSAALDAQYHGADVLNGGDGDDTLVGMGGADTLLGGAGNDVLKGDDDAGLFAADDSLDGGDGDDRIFGGGGNDTLTGGAGNDSLSGQDGDDQVAGGDGNDTLISGAGDDKMDGGAGDDVYIVSGTGTKRIVDGGGVDRLVLDWKSSDTKLAFGSLMLVNQATRQQIHIENFDPNDLLGSLSIEEFVLQDDAGNSILLTADQLLARGRDLTGTPGADQLLGSGLDETVDALEGDDLVLAGDGNDSVIGGDGSDSLYGEGGQDNLDGGNGDDALFGGSGNDHIDAGAGRDLIDGGADADTMAGGDGDDTYVVDDAGDVVTELGTPDGGDDTVQSSVTYALGSNVENLVLTGDADIDGTGNADDNTLTGNDGKNVLDGGVGADVMRGGLGDDVYHVERGSDIVIEGVDQGHDAVVANTSYTLSDNVEALVLVGAADYDGTGNALDNLIIGNGGNNVIDGGAGADTMAGGAGWDTYFVDDSADQVLETANGGHDTVNSSATYRLGPNLEDLNLLGTAAIDGTGNAMANLITGNSAANRIDASAGDDAVYGGGGDDVLVGGDGSDALFGEAGNDLLDGGAGDDLLDGGPGVDTMAGGSGSDRYIVDDSADTIVEGRAGSLTDIVEATATFTLPANVEFLYLEGSADIDGTGNDGANWIFGNSGVNRLAGGGGNDFYQVQNTGDTIVEDADAGYDRVLSTVDYTLGDNIEDLRLEYGSVGDRNTAVQAIGNASDNWITGNQQANVIEGRGGNDTLDGQDGNDTISGGEGNDMLFGGWDSAWGDEFVDNRDLLSGGAGDDTLNGYSGNDTLRGDDGNDVIYGGDVGWTEENRVLTNDDVAYGGAGNDTIDGDSGADLLFGEDGDDSIYGGQATRYPFGDFGRIFDPATGQYRYGTFSENDTLDGGSGDDTLDGGVGDDSLRGGPGVDEVFGSDGNDTLDGGAGKDTLAGGADDDIYEVDGTFQVVQAPSTLTWCGTPEEHRRLQWDTDTVLEDYGSGYDVVEAYGGFVLPGNVEELRLVTDPNADPAYAAALAAYGQDGTGNDLDNLLVGNEFANRLDGAGGADTMIGGAGDDTYVVDDSGDTIVEQPGQGIDTVVAQMDGITLGADVENLVLAGDAWYGWGNELDNQLTGGSNDDELFAGDGNDTLIGGAGSDWLSGEGGDDTYVFRPGEGDDEISDDTGSDVLFIGGPLGAADLYAERDGDSLWIHLGGDNAGSVYIDNWFANAAGQGVNRIEFCDASTLDHNGIAALVAVPDEPPVAQPDSLVAHEDGGAVTITESELLANDSDPDAGDWLTVVAVGLSALGADVTWSEGAVHYDLGNGYQSLAEGDTLQDGFSYMVADSHGATAESAVNVTIVGVNDAPDAMADEATEAEDSIVSATGNVLANDSDVDNGDVLGVASTGVQVGVYGSVELAGDGSFTYALANGSTAVQSLAAGQVVTDTFSYTAHDAIGATSTASLVVTITGANDGPTAFADAAEVSEDGTLAAAGNVLSNDTDPDNGDTLSVTSTGTLAGSYGSLVLGPDGNYSYVLGNASAAVQRLAAGQAVTDTFTYTAADTSGATSPASLVVTVTGANDAPTLVTPAPDVSTAEGQALSIDLPDTMFTDIDQGDVLAYSAQLAAGGNLPSWLAFDANGLKLIGAPPRGSAGQIFDVQLTAIDRSGATASDVFRISVTVPPGLVVTGTPGNDTLTGGWGNDTIDGGAGSDTMIGDFRDDTYFVDSYVNTGTGKGNEGLGNGQDPPPPGHSFNWNDGVGTSPGNPNSAHGYGGGSSPPPGTGDIVVEAPGEGWDTVMANVSYVLPQNVEAVRLQGSANLDAFGNSGNNWLVGNAGANVLAGNDGNDLLTAGAGNDSLYGGAGNDVIEGQDGADSLYGGDGADALLGGAGADQVVPGAGRAFVAGGTGSDSITMGTDATVVAFNRGDGADTITTLGNVPLVLSLGGGIRVEDVALRRSGNDLFVDAGNGDTIELSKWYANNSAHPQLELQIVSAAPGGDSLHDNRIEWFDGQGLAAAFDNARKVNSNLTRWDIMNAALANHLGGSDIAAFGGDLACLYGVNGTLAGVGLDPAAGVLADSSFGIQAQALHSSQQLQAGPARVAG